MIDQPRKVAILGGNRTPFARSHTAYKNASNLDLLTAALDGLIARFSLSGERLGQVAGGAVMKHSRDFNLTRESVLGTTLDPHTPAVDLQMACGTSLEATIFMANQIALGQIDSAVASGTDTTSDAPIAVNDTLRKALLKASAAKSTKDSLLAFKDIRPGHFAPDAPSNGEPRTGLSMGEHMAITAHDFGITRGEQDQIAAASHQHMAAAYDRGFYDDLVTGFQGLTRDNNLRPDSNEEKLAKLKPVFGKQFGSEATMTAGNSTPLTDGAAAVLLSTEEWAAERGLEPLAYFVDAENAAVDFVHGAEGLLMAPTHAVYRLLKRNNLTLQDFDLYEVHEAFASTVACLRNAWASDEYCRDVLGADGALGTFDDSKLNVNGSSLAAGHPFAATGARIVAQTAKELHARKAADGQPKRALISICAAGGQGVAAILEA